MTENMGQSKKLGMVFEGGANRTIFSCGVMDALLEADIMPDYMIGVSAGIAFGVSYLSRQKGRNLEVMEKYMADKRYMGMRHLLDRKSVRFIILDLYSERCRTSLYHLTMIRLRHIREP